jgi:hypothetical protein
MHVAAKPQNLHLCCDNCEYYTLFDRLLRFRMATTYHGFRVAYATCMGLQPWLAVAKAPPPRTSRILQVKISLAGGVGQPCLQLHRAPISGINKRNRTSNVVSAKYKSEVWAAMLIYTFMHARPLSVPLDKTCRARRRKGRTKRRG